VVSRLLVRIVRRGRKAGGCNCIARAEDLGSNGARYLTSAEIECHSAATDG